jgi:hypothetical protein
VSDQKLHPIHKARLRKIGMDRMSSDAWDVVTSLLAEIDDLERLPQPLVGFIPQTYGDAVMRGWIKHGDCPPHEWDNRTSAANARWLLERAGFKADGEVK